ncbi:MAG TPA: hypothetical protein VGM06_07150 [Polyangiaceae bacterium]|jgi:hypothetical protein
MGVALAVAFLAWVSAHVALVLGLARRRRWATAAAAAVLWPIAPWSGWRLGMRGRSLAWIAALALYALGVAWAHTTRASRPPLT